MRSVSVSRELLDDIVTALNQVKNHEVGGFRWRSTYSLAAELTRVLRTSDGLLRDEGG